MTADELRAITAAGPAVVMVSREDMLALLDERDYHQQENVTLSICIDRLRAALATARREGAEAMRERAVALAVQWQQKANNLEPRPWMRELPATVEQRRMAAIYLRECAASIHALPLEDAP